MKKDEAASNSKKTLLPRELEPDENSRSLRYGFAGRRCQGRTPFILAAVGNQRRVLR